MDEGSQQQGWSWMRWEAVPTPQPLQGDPPTPLPSIPLDSTATTWSQLL